MKNTNSLTTILALLCFISAAGQSKNIQAPAENIFEKKWIKNGRSEMGYYAISEGKKTELCSFVIDIHADNKTLSVFTTLNFLNSSEQWTDTSISDAATFKPIYRSSFNKDREYILKYGREITGHYYDKKTRKRNAVKETATGSYFDSYTYPYLLGLLPLSTGYKKDLAVYEYMPKNSSNIKNARIEEVKNNIYVSEFTGEHKVWQVSVFEEGTNSYYEYYIDKETRRIWKIEVKSKGQQLLLVDKEIDYNPFKTKFNKEETLKLIKSGSAVISGEAFARDNENEGILKGMALLNINKKQYARQGTTIVLIPYTDFFKEWVKLNEASRKKGRGIPLPKEAAECIKTTTVYDDKGSFEFVNLMPGDYLVFTEFGYVHTSRRTEVVGYTDTYVNGIFQGSSANTQSFSYRNNAAASIKKVVTIKKEAEQVSIKLKKTR